MLSDLVVRLLITLWLIDLSIYDVRCRQLPHALTTLPLLVVGGLISLNEIAGLTGLAPDWNNTAAVLAFASVLLSDTPLAMMPGLAAVLVAFALGTSSGQIWVGLWLLTLGLNKAGIIGEGDAKTIMILVVVYPDIRLLIVLAIMLPLCGLVLLWWRARAALPMWLLAITRDLLAWRVPAHTGETGQMNLPMLPMLTLGTLIYVWGLR